MIRRLMWAERHVVANGVVAEQTFAAEDDDPTYEAGFWIELVAGQNLPGVVTVSLEWLGTAERGEDYEADLPGAGVWMSVLVSAAAMAEKGTSNVRKGILSMERIVSDGLLGVRLISRTFTGGRSVGGTVAREDCGWGGWGWMAGMGIGGDVMMGLSAYKRLSEVLI